MGSLGGKLGYIAGILIFIIFAVPVIHITPGSCFFEGGCGNREPIGLIFAVLILFGMATVSGLLTKALVNYLSSRRVR